MSEIKEMVVEKLFETFKECDYFSDLKDMEYQKYPDGEEMVIATFKTDNGFERTKKVTVTADSNIAIILDVVNGLYKG